MTTLKHGWTVEKDESGASCTPDGSTTIEVFFEGPGTYSVFFDDIRKAQAETLLDGMICAEQLYENLNEGENEMTTKNENSIDNFAIALLNASMSLKRSIRDIDELNGRLDELDNYREHRTKLSDDARKTMQEAYEFYRALPVWDTIEDLANRLLEVRNEVGNIILEEVKNERKDSK